MDKSPKASGIILLTYKGKVLLMHKQKGVLDPENHPWGLIECVKKDSETFEQALNREVFKETGINLENIEYVSKYHYHANLTDDNVNKMKRAEHQLLDFFNARDLEKLLLKTATQNFIQKHSYLI